MVRRKLYFLLYALLLIPLQHSWAANTWTPDTCSLATEISQKAYEKFTSDKKVAIQLFIKAQRLCPKTSEHSYNLGLAYLKYGQADKAEHFLKEAAKAAPNNLLIQHNFAEVLLLNNKPQQASAIASRAEYIQNTAHGSDVLARSLLAMGKIEQAFAIIHNALEAHHHIENIRISAQDIMDNYLAHFLSMIKEGKVEQGLAGLSKISSYAEGSSALILALFSINRLDQALTAANNASKTFPNNKDISELWNNLFNHRIQMFYEKFTKGERSIAVAEAKTFSEQYPDNVIAKKAFNKLLNAYLENVTEINTPPTKQQTITTQPTSSAKDILTGMASGLLNGPTANTTSLLVDVDVDIPQGTESNIHAVGILIANQHYNRKNSAINDVLYAENDAIIMMKYLTQVMEYSKHNIIMEIDATLGDLRNIFGTIQQKGKMHSYLRGKGRSDLFIYYVGHGAPGPNGNSAYLVPVDADIDYIANNGYDLNELYKIINHLPARNVTIVLDTCFSGNSAGGPLFKNISPAMVKTANPLLGPGNTLIFAGADKGQVSTWYPEKQHSLFSYYFFKGLRGMADNNQDNIITAGEMQDYLYDEVPHWAQRKSNRKQTPIMRGPRDFILAKLKK